MKKVINTKLDEVLETSLTGPGFVLKQEDTIHFMGIGGVGMSGIAEVLLNKGFKVSGSDLSESKTTIRLAALGADIFYGHCKENVKKAQIVVVSTAIQEDNSELLEARRLQLLVLRRAQMLGELMRSYYGIAISGTHGKTTTTSLVSSVLTEGGLDPTFVIGGILHSIGGNARLGKSPYFVVEADESDASFLYLPSPRIIVVTNIDADHMETYGGSFDRLCDTFLKFLHRLPDNGLAVLCTDDPVIAELSKKVERPVLTYGFNAQADVQGVDFKQNGMKSYFKVRRKGKEAELSLMANLQGRHNALNSLAVVGVATHLGISDEAIGKALAQFQGVGRRFQTYGEISMPKGSVMLIDDYGHHPKEVESTISAVRDIWPQRRLVLVFQPHRYTRTADLMKEFAAVLSTVDRLLLLPVYSAGESPIPGANGVDLHRLILEQGFLQSSYLDSMNDLRQLLPDILIEGDVLLVQGAGSIGQLAHDLVWKSEGNW